jgi:ELWxxDGT repeat protein
MTEFGGKVYFAADDGVAGTELWVSDGTAAGTTLLADLCARKSWLFYTHDLQVAMSRVERSPEGRMQGTSTRSDEELRRVSL